MTLTLPRARVDTKGRISADEGVLDEHMRSLLTSVGATSARGISSHAFLPLDDEHWLVGRRERDGVTWRVVDSASTRSFGHPAWLWTESSAFEQHAALAVPAPLPLQLRQLLRLAAPFSGSYQRTTQALAATVEALRRRQGPVEVVVPRAAFTAPDYRTLWFALSVLTLLPPHWRDTLWVCTWEEHPKGESWDLILTDHPHDDFVTVHGLSPVEPVDPVASYLLDRMLDDDPESAEAAPYLDDPVAADTWLGGLQAHLAGESSQATSASQSETSPRAGASGDAGKALAWRLRSEGPLDEALVEALASLTAKHADPTPWRALEGRRPEEVARAVGAWLDHPRRVVPDEVLLRIIAGLRPRGSELVALYGALARWIDRRTHGPSLLGLLVGMLEDNATHVDTPTLASLWTEWLRLTIREGLHSESATVGAVPVELARRGSPVAPVLGWLALPREDRTLPGLHALVEQLCPHPGGARTATTLYGELVAREEDSLAEELVRAWVRLAAKDRPPQAQLMAEAVRGGPHAPTWARTAAELSSGDTLRSLVSAVSKGSPKAWSAAGDAIIRAGQRDLALKRLGDILPEAAEALEPSARSLLAPALQRASFPNEDLTAVGWALAQVPEAWSLWSLLVITSAGPGELGDETIDPTVITFCQNAPGSQAERALARRCLQLLGDSMAWPVIDHARWLVRFLMVPAPVPDEIHVQLAGELVSAVARREDGVPHLAAITNALLDLPPDHPALFLYLQLLLPRAWRNGPPPGFRAALRTDVGNPRTRSLLDLALRQGRR